MEWAISRSLPFLSTPFQIRYYNVFIKVIIHFPLDPNENREYFKLFPLTQELSTNTSCL